MSLAIYILVLEGLLLDRSRYEPRFGEVADVRRARFESVQNIPEYAAFASTLSVFTVYCHDKLEGAFETGDFLRERHWC